MKPIKYIVANERDLQWGLSICSVGFEEITPHSPYPTREHASGYYFSTEKGRVLHEYQLIYIPEGEGFLKTESAKEFYVKAGYMFLLFPGEWHTYSPNPKTGWKQYWIGFEGLNMDNRVSAGFLNRENPAYYVGFNEELIRLYKQAIEIAHQEKAFFQQMLAGITNYLLGLMYSLSRNYQFEENKEMIQIIDKARLWMREEVDTDIAVQEIATKVGMSYSHFRKIFKEYTGLSPSQYFHEIKLQRAKELLLATKLSVKEIAYNLHFESPDYFSTWFKQRTGMKPGDFRG